MRPRGRPAATLPPPFHRVFGEMGPAGPFFVREQKDADDVRTGAPTRAGDRAAGRAGPAGRRRARGGARDAVALLRLRRLADRRRPRALRARQRPAPRLPRASTPSTSRRPAPRARCAGRSTSPASSGTRSRCGRPSRSTAAPSSRASWWTPVHEAVTLGVDGQRAIEIPYAAIVRGNLIDER